MVYDSRSPLLMVDRDLIDTSGGTALTVCEATRHPDNLILKRGGPGSADETHAEFGGSVYYVDGKFRMWYMAKGAAAWGTGYAESQDGIPWTKPSLGLQNYAGNTDNNLVDLGSRGFGGAVFYDPTDPDPQRLYKIPIGCTTRNGRQGIGTFAYSRFDEADKVDSAGVAVPATWKGTSSLSGVAAPTVRLHVRFHGGRFRHESPRLYAVYFSQPKDIEQ